MANHLSAKKDLRKSQKRSVLNKSRKTRMKTLLKKAEEAIKTQSMEVAREAFKEAQSQIMRATQKKTLERNNASRKVSKLFLKMKARFGE